MLTGTPHPIDAEVKPVEAVLGEDQSLWKNQIESTADGVLSAVLDCKESMLLF